MNKIKLYNIFQQITPPFLFNLIKRSRLYGGLKQITEKVARPIYNPTWNLVRGGILSGHEMFLDQNGDWQKEMLNGLYDKFIFDYLEKIDLSGKTIFDIGTHVGYHSMCFAKLAGKTGKVLSFEPNKTNVERTKYILSKNPDLASRIKLYEVALSDKNGTMDFVCSDDIENGTSSGGFIESASPLYKKANYEKIIGFKRYQVRTVRLDDIKKELNISGGLSLMKIDTEGAEGLILGGAQEILRLYSPLLLIEVHSIAAMFDVTNVLREHDYKIELIKKETDGRCFLACSKPRK